MIIKRVSTFSLLIFLCFSACKDGVYTECNKHKDGQYELVFENPSIPSAIITRTGSTQVELTSEGDSVYNRVDWVDDCTYNLIFQKGPSFMEFTSKPIQTKIVAIMENGYKFKTVLLDSSGISFDGTATKIK